MKVDDGYDEDDRNKKKNDYYAEYRKIMSIFGYGINSYLDLLKRLICTFAIMSLISMLAMGVIMSEHHSGSKKAWQRQWNLSNMPSTTLMCLQQPFVTRQIPTKVSCQGSGSKISKLKYYGGVVDYKPETITNDGSFEFYFNYCGDPSLLKEENDCSTSVRNDVVEQ